MEVASLCPLPVGLVPWASPEPACSVVIKATFSLAEDGEAPLSDTQEPLTLDRPSALDPDELATASDFAPFKARADVLLLGHAKADEPSTGISALLRVDGLTRRFFALASFPATQIPLAAPYLRDVGGDGEVLLRVGPEAPWSPGRQMRLGDRSLDAHGLPVGPLGRGFDFGFFNAASPEQQVDLIRPSATLLLRGLLLGAERREVRLPGLRPVVFLMRERLDGRTSADDIALRCDTLVIDTDRALCTLTWRGIFAPPPEDERSCLLIDLAWPGEKPTFLEVRHKLALAERGGTGAASSPEDALEPEPEEISVDAWIAEEDEPTGRHAPIRDGAALRGAGFRLGLPLGAAPIRASQVDSFELQANPDPPEPPTAQVIEETIRLSARELDAAFEIWEHDAAPAPATAPIPAQAGTLGSTGSEGPSRLGAALPFRTVVTEAAPASSVEPDPLSETQTEGPALFREALPFAEATRAPSDADRAPAQMPGIAFGQGLGTPFGIALGQAPAITTNLVSPTPTPTETKTARGPGPLSLVTYAAIKVALREGAAARAEVLASHGLDEITWSLDEQRRAEELDADARAGNRDKVLAFHAALRRAEEAAREEAPAVPLDQYVALRVALEDGEDATTTLASRGLVPASYRRLHRAMTRRANADPTFGAALWRALVEARRSR